MVSEILYAGKTLAEVAGYDDYQMYEVINKRRDKYGRLVRTDPSLPSWVKVDENGFRVVSNPRPFKVMFEDINKKRGLKKSDIKGLWDRFLENNPKFGKTHPIS